MKKKKKNKEKNIEKSNYERGQIFVKIMAGILAVLMIVAFSGTLLFYLIGR